MTRRQCARAQLRQNLQAFLLGGVTAFSVGYYRLQKDMFSAASAVEGSINALGSETVDAHAALQKRVGALEAEVAKLKGAIAEEQAKKE